MAMTARPRASEAGRAGRGSTSPSAGARSSPPRGGCSPSATTAPSRPPSRRRGRGHPRARAPLLRRQAGALPRGRALAARSCRRGCSPPRSPPATAEAALGAAVDRWLDVAERGRGMLLAAHGAQGFGRDPEVEAIFDRARERTADQVIEILRPGRAAERRRPPELRAAVRAYAGFVEAATFDWLRGGPLTRDAAARAARRRPAGARPRRGPASRGEAMTATAPDADPAHRRGGRRASCSARTRSPGGGSGDPRYFFGAGYALLLQVAHPTVGSGVRDHSNFQEDPWGRLMRTTDYLYLLVYGGPAAGADGAAAARAAQVDQGRRTPTAAATTRSSPRPTPGCTRP